MASRARSRLCSWRPEAPPGAGSKSFSPRFGITGRAAAGAGLGAGTSEGHVSGVYGGWVGRVGRVGLTGAWTSRARRLRLRPLRTGCRLHRQRRHSHRRCDPQQRHPLLLHAARAGQRARREAARAFRPSSPSNTVPGRFRHLLPQEPTRLDDKHVTHRRQHVRRRLLSHRSPTACPDGGQTRPAGRCAARHPSARPAHSTALSPRPDQASEQGEGGVVSITHTSASTIASTKASPYPCPAQSQQLPTAPCACAGPSPSPHPQPLLRCRHRRRRRRRSQYTSPRAGSPLTGPPPTAVADAPRTTSTTRAPSSATRGPHSGASRATTTYPIPSPHVRYRRQLNATRSSARRFQEPAQWVSVSAPSLARHRHPS